MPRRMIACGTGSVKRLMHGYHVNPQADIAEAEVTTPILFSSHNAATTCIEAGLKLYWANTSSFPLMALHKPCFHFMFHVPCSFPCLIP